MADLLLHSMKLCTLKCILIDSVQSLVFCVHWNSFAAAQRMRRNSETIYDVTMTEKMPAQRLSAWQSIHRQSFHLISSSKSTRTCECNEQKKTRESDHAIACGDALDLLPLFHITTVQSCRENDLLKIFIHFVVAFTSHETWGIFPFVNFSDNQVNTLNLHAELKLIVWGRKKMHFFNNFMIYYITLRRNGTSYIVDRSAKRFANILSPYHGNIWHK